MKSKPWKNWAKRKGWKLLLFFLLVYLFSLIPVFFLYTNHDLNIKRNIEVEYFNSLSKDLEGDCQRIVQNFIVACPFPCREVHLSSAHTIVEIQINEKWYAYDPSYRRFFNFKNAVQISFDINRGYIAPYMKEYPYTQAFKRVYFYHNFYFIFLKKTCPFYDKLALKYFSVL